MSSAANMQTIGSIFGVKKTQSLPAAGGAVVNLAAN